MSVVRFGFPPFAFGWFSRNYHRLVTTCPMLNLTKLTFDIVEYSALLTFDKVEFVDLS